MDDRQLQGKTKGHYDDFPFDFLTQEDEDNIAALQPAPFLAFAENYLHPHTCTAEIGCGPGRGTLFMQNRGVDLFAIDLSMGSLRLARRRAANTAYVCATNLDLPFKTETFDAVVSDGVIHHTPDPRRSISELARILLPGGFLYLGVYRRNRYYYYVYTWLGRPIRCLEKFKVGSALINCTILPLYYLVHLFKSRGKRTWSGAKNFFYDYIITPQATFHTREEIEAWSREVALELLDYEENVGNVHAFVFKKISVVSNGYNE
jgi:SAM-dependent methyltransferase